MNQAWAEPNSLFDLFLESFRIGQGTQKLLQHVVVVCLDPKAFDRCSQLHPNCYYLETSGTDFSGEKLFATPDYLKMMWRRIELLTQVLEMGFNFIFTVLIFITHVFVLYKSFGSIYLYITYGRLTWCALHLHLHRTHIKVNINYLYFQFQGFKKISYT